MAKRKQKTIEEIRAEFQKSMQKMADKHGTSITFSTNENGKERTLSEFKPKK